MRLTIPLVLIAVLALPALEANAKRKRTPPPTDDPALRGHYDTGGVTGGPNWQLNPADRPWRVRGKAELGFTRVLSHTIQFGQDGTELDYVNEGSQDVLFPFTRLQAELELWKRFNVMFLSSRSTCRPGRPSPGTSGSTGWTSPRERPWTWATTSGSTG